MNGTPSTLRSISPWVLNHADTLPRSETGGWEDKADPYEIQNFLQLLLSTKMDLRVVNTALTPYGSKVVQKIQFIFTKLQVYSYCHNTNF